jgi:mRNA-degrading endonuclease RelE of RelBE toxin-antitoxin system
VVKDILKFPNDYRSRIREIINQLPVNPFVGDIQKIKGEKYGWRRRVGVYRIYFDIVLDENLVRVTNVERRSSKTY